MDPLIKRLRVEANRRDGARRCDRPFYNGGSQRYQKPGKSEECCKMTWYANERQDGPTSVYVMECADRGKIGLAVDVAKRRATLQLACPLPIALTASLVFSDFRTARAVERELHAKFAADRLHGEWFAVPPAVLATALSAYQDRQHVAASGASEAIEPHSHDLSPVDQRFVDALSF